MLQATKEEVAVELEKLYELKACQIVNPGPPLPLITSADPTTPTSNPSAKQVVLMQLPHLGRRSYHASCTRAQGRQTPGNSGIVRRAPPPYERQALSHVCANHEHASMSQQRRSRVSLSLVAGHVAFIPSMGGVWGISHVCRWQQPWTRRPTMAWW